MVLSRVCEVYTHYYNHCGRHLLLYSGTPFNGHPSTADTHDITDTCDCPDRVSIDFNTLKTPE